MTELTAVRTSDGAWTFDGVDPTIVAAAIPASPPAAWFERRAFDRVTPLTFTADGQVYGHIADRSIPHIGLPGRRTAPRSRSGYRWYLSGQVRCDDGTLVSTGRITMDGSHASLGASAEEASAHYDSTAVAVADVTAWDDDFGVAVAGAARPSVTPEQMRTAMASPPSGDWRVIGGELEMVAALLVNVPGFPTPRVNLAASGQVTALVAAGAIPRTPAPEAAATGTPTDPDPTTAAACGGEEHSMDPSGDSTPDGGGPSPAGRPEGTVRIAGTDLTGQAVEVTDDGHVVVEVRVPESDVSAASDDEVMAASAVLTQRQQMRALTAAVEAVPGLIATVDDLRREVAAEREARAADARAREATALLAGLPGG